MNNSVIKLLLRLCAFMLIVLLIEWGSIRFSETPDDKASSSLEGEENQMMELPELKLAKQPIETYVDMVEKPLFIKDRKPVVELNEDISNLEDSKIEDLVLVGIYSKDGQMIALFSKQGKDKKYIKSIEGDDVVGWFLKEIKVDQIILEREDEQQTLMLRKPKPKTKPESKKTKTKTKLKARIKPKLVVNMQRKPKFREII